MSNTFQSSSSNSNTEIFELCKEFALITNTDTDLAMIILQQNQWNLEQAVCAYIDLGINETKLSVKKITDPYSTSSVCFFFLY